MQFTVARLFPRNGSKREMEKIRSAAASGNYLFLSDREGNHEIYSIYNEGSGDTRVPNCETWISPELGVYNHGDKCALNVHKFDLNANPPQSVKFQVRRHPLQMRYEYALNFLSKIGSHFSRNGLDYLNGTSVFYDFGEVCWI